MANEEIREKNIEIVLKACTKLCIEHGIANVTYEMISRASGLSRKSLERYFVNRTECMIRAAEWLGKQLQRSIRPFSDEFLKNDAYTAGQLMDMYLKDISKLFMYEPRIFVYYSEIKTYIFYNSTDRTLDYSRVLATAGDIEVYKEIYRRGQQDGTVAASIDIGTASNYLFELLISFYASMAALYLEHPEQAREYIDHYTGNIMKLFFT